MAHADVRGRPADTSASAGAPGCPPRSSGRGEVVPAPARALRYR